MTYVLSLVLLFGLAATKSDRSDQEELFHNYAKAYRVAQKTHRPLLVILNPGGASRAEPIKLESVRKTKHRRELLNDYIVAVIDTGTKEGQTIHQLFRNKPLPHVSIIDKRQRFQLYQSSEKMYGQLWTEVLERYRNGEPVVEAPLCST